jgi:hypothetical protein
MMHDPWRTRVTDKADKILAAIERLAVKVTRVETDIADLKAGQARILAHLDIAELKGRVEEQSRTIASLISTKVAAVPSC